MRAGDRPWHLPVVNQIWFSGAIYARQSLQRDHSIDEQRSGAEVCAQAFERWGYDCPRYLNGEYALVIRQDDSETLFCARDHAGVHPFYYAVMDGALYWAGSIAELLRDLPRLPPLDERYVASYLSHRRYWHPERTFFAGVSKLPPGHSLVFRGGQVMVQRYWFPDQIAALPPASDRFYIEAGRRLLSDAVAERVDGRVGAHVSGGLDSSAIAGLAVQSAHERGLPPPVGFAWHMAGPDGAAENLIEVVREQFSLELLACEPDAATIRDLLRDDPALGAQALDLYHEKSVQIAAAERGISVLLSGWGGEQSLSCDGAGLARHYLAHGDARGLRLIGRGMGLRAFASGLSSALGEMRGRAKRSSADVGFADPALVKRSPAYSNAPRHASAGQTFQFSSLEQGWYVPRLESWAESGRRHGITYRYPLLDRRVIEFALAIPPHLFRRGGENRWFFRQLTEGILPDQVRLHRSKKERVRVQALGSVLSDVVDSIGSDLGQGTDGERARYVDMERLRRALHTADPANARPSTLHAALQFLGV